MQMMNIDQSFGGNAFEGPPSKEGEEKLYMNKNYFISVNEIKITTAEIKKGKQSLEESEQALEKEESKSFLRKDKKRINDLRESISNWEKEISKKEQKLLTQQEFLSKQEAFLSTHPSVDLEGKNRKEIIDLLISDPQLVHLVWGTYYGLDLQKIVSGGKELGNNNPFGWSILPKRNEFGSHSKKDLLYESRRSRFFKVVEAIPVFFNQPERKGFGIIWPSLDVGGRDGFSSFWTVVSKFDGKIQEYLAQNPEVLLEIFKERFKNYAVLPYKEKPQDHNYAERMKLVSREFIDVDAGADVDS